MAEALTSVIAVCKWFMEQKQTNAEAIECLRDMGDSIERMLPVLVKLNTQGLDAASGIIVNLWQCLENTRRIYRKYKHGYTIRKPWMTPGRIKEKAEVHTKKVQGSYFELQMALNIMDHNQMVNQDQAARPAAGNNAADAVAGEFGAADIGIEFEETEGVTCGNWEIHHLNIELNLGMMGVPATVLAQGSSGVVGLGFYTGSPVAIKTAMSNVLAAAKKDTEVLRCWFKENLCLKMAASFRFHFSFIFGYSVILYQTFPVSGTKSPRKHFP